jgi:hypothetical protein
MRIYRGKDVTTALLTFAVAIVGASVVGAAASSNGDASVQLQRRHDDDDHASGNHMHGTVVDWDESEDDDGDGDVSSTPAALGMDMDMNMHSVSGSPTAASAVSSTTAVKPHDPHMHSHGSHEAAKVTLNDVDIHKWHDFPPSYLAADFRLTNDSAIFGEVFDEDWDPENASGHKGLMAAHVLAMCLAYFGALPIGEPSTRKTLYGWLTTLLSSGSARGGPPSSLPRQHWLPRYCPPWLARRRRL